MTFATLGLLYALTWGTRRMDAHEGLWPLATGFWGVATVLMLFAGRWAALEGDTYDTVTVYACAAAGAGVFGFRLGVGSAEWPERRSRERQ